MIRTITLTYNQFGIIQVLQSSPIPQTSNWSGTFFAISYSKPALVSTRHCIANNSQTFWQWFDSFFILLLRSVEFLFRSLTSQMMTNNNRHRCRSLAKNFGSFFTWPNIWQKIRENLYDLAHFILFMICQILVYISGWTI